MRNPLTEKELYAKLGTLSEPMEQFRKHNSAALTAEQVELMKDVYEDVNVKSHGQMPQRLNVGCDACVREAFVVFISLFDKMHKNPLLNSDAEPETKDVLLKDDTDYSDQLGGNGLKGDANKAPANQLDLDIEAQKINARFETRAAQIMSFGFAYDAEKNLFTKEGEKDLAGDVVKQTTDEDFNNAVSVFEQLEEQSNTSISIETPKGGTVVPPAVHEEQPKKEPLLEGKAMNTDASKTPAQKTAEKKAAAKLKGDANKK